ncbi:MAG TPA: VOC family protein [Gaiellaceae bacterium]|nr:VOC family protein [Gaiellaceae bacterium]
MIQVERVDFVTIPTRDIPRAVAWYQNLFELPASDVNDGELETPNVTLGFWNPEEQGLEFEPNTAGFALRVEDVGRAVAEVEAAGAEVLGIEDSGICHLGFIKDPDGNVLILHRRYAPKVSRGQG